MKSNLPSKKKKSLPKEVQNNSFPIVAIGASAGGLEAVTQLLQNLPSDTGMAFIYVQHLSPDNKSMLVSLLAKATKMKVGEAKDGMTVEPNNFYVIPPNKEMTIRARQIKLRPRKKDGIISLPIDTFFSSLAKNNKQDVIGIILSGSATDGTLGLKAIKEEGGITFAQDSSAKFNGMPKSAIAEGVVDFVLSPKQIARELVSLNKKSFFETKSQVECEENEIENSSPDLKIILEHLHKRIGVDFSNYKTTTIKRRILRRMHIHKIKSLKKYAELFNKKNNEVDLLYNDLLINVTSFFRDANAFQFLKNNLFPKLLKNRVPGEPFRIWVPACSTGQEAYSIAMVLLEIQDIKSMKIPIQIFATDLSGPAIAKARNGKYSESEVESISPKRLQRFFTKSKNIYYVAKPLREICIFAPHNILQDPPFSRIDFISCCNLLIYLDASAQKKAITTFHYALKDGGYLMLGRSETIGASTSLFTSVNRKYKIYLRKKNSGNLSIPAIAPHFQQTMVFDNTHFSKTPLITKNRIDSFIDSVLVTRYVPACVVINKDLEILQFRGATSLYLGHPAGKASFNVLRMARPEFAFELRHAIHNAIKTKQVVRKLGIEMKSSSGKRIVNIEVSPLKIEGEELLLLVVFTEQQCIEVFSEGGQRDNKNGKNDLSARNRRIKRLEEELASARADMLSISNDQEIINEELQSANEEVVSSNEELRTLNEELETSKEEIESTNEELISTNQELQIRNEQIEELNSFSEAILATISQPMVVLDKNIRVKTANNEFYKQFHMGREGTEGKKLYELGNKQWDIRELHHLLEDIIPRKSQFSDFEVRHQFPIIGERIMLLRAKRIIQKTINEQLILLIIEDITEKANLRDKEKRLFSDLQEANKLLESMNNELAAFNYVSSHDLQEPLRKIQNFSTRILEKEQPNLSDESKYYFERLQTSANRMQSLIEDLLAYSRVNATERKLEEIDLNQIINEVKNDLIETIQEKDAVIESSGLGKIKAVPFQLRQCLNNLISNALKFSKEKTKPHVKIKSEIVKGIDLKQPGLSSEKKYCHISISDNGIGFSSKYKDRIFEVFQRLHNYDEYKGTGIGLAICKKIVENHNGIITATGKLNKGARFDIYIPA